MRSTTSVLSSSEFKCKSNLLPPANVTITITLKYHPARSTSLVLLNHMVFKLTMLPLLPLCSREPPPHESPSSLSCQSDFLLLLTCCIIHTFALVLALTLVAEHLVVVQHLPEADRLYCFLPSQLPKFDKRADMPVLFLRVFKLVTPLPIA